LLNGIYFLGKREMQLIILLINLINLNSCVRAHGDHTKDLYTGEEILTNYENVPQDAFEKVSKDKMIASITFKKR
jgi:hypothetical protein